MKRALAALVTAAAVLAPTTAQAATKPPVVPCRSCTYWTQAVATLDDDAHTSLRLFAEHVVYRNGQDHVRNIAWSGEDDHGAFAWDAVKVHLRRAVDDVRIMDPIVWDPAGRFDEEYVGRRNGRTVHGIEAVAVGWWRDRKVTVVVGPTDVIDGADVAALGLTS